MACHQDMARGVVRQEAPLNLVLDDFNELISNEGLEQFMANELPEYAKLTMSFVQSFKFHNSRDNPDRKSVV